MAWSGRSRTMNVEVQETQPVTFPFHIVLFNGCVQHKHSNSSVFLPRPGCFFHHWATPCCHMSNILIQHAPFKMSCNNCRPHDWLILLVYLENLFCSFQTADFPLKTNPTHMYVSACLQQRFSWCHSHHVTRFINMSRVSNCFIQHPPFFRLRPP